MTIELNDPSMHLDIGLPRVDPSRPCRSDDCVTCATCGQDLGNTPIFDNVACVQACRCCESLHRVQDNAPTSGATVRRKYNTRDAAGIAAILGYDVSPYLAPNTPLPSADEFRCAAMKGYGTVRIGAGQAREIIEALSLARSGSPAVLGPGVGNLVASVASCITPPSQSSPAASIAQQTDWLPWILGALAIGGIGVVGYAMTTKRGGRKYRA